MDSGTMAGLLAPLVPQVAPGDVLAGIGGEFCGATASELALPGGLGWSSAEGTRKEHKTVTDQ